MASARPVDELVKKGGGPSDAAALQALKAVIAAGSADSQEMSGPGALHLGGTIPASKGASRGLGIAHKSLQHGQYGSPHVKLIKDNLYDGLGSATDMQKFRVRLLKQNLGRRCIMKDSLNIVDPKKVKSKVQTLFTSAAGEANTIDLMNITDRGEDTRQGLRKLSQGVRVGRNKKYDSFGNPRRQPRVVFNSLKPPKDKWPIAFHQTFSETIGSDGSSMELGGGTELPPRTAITNTARVSDIFYPLTPGAPID